ncbi:MAG: TetR family transcriptional regulator [Spirochaetes bacterium]|jgi:AcrR family transcriptional regulator|nr:TetR family transcriptional regulator [Spirochaetota bacterium]
MARSRPPDTYHHGNLKAGLIELALQKLHEGLEPAALSIRALAAELGVSAGAPYRHFPTAEALIAAVAARGFAALRKQMEAHSAVNAPTGDPADLSPMEALERMGAAYVRFAAAHPQWYRAMFTLPSNALGDYPDLESEAGEAFNLLERRVAAFHASRPDARMRPREAAIAAWAYVHGLAGLTTDRLSSIAEDPAALQHLMTALTRGL